MRVVRALRLPRRSRDLLGVVVSAVALGAFVWWAFRQERPHFPTGAADITLLVAAVGLYAAVTAVRGWRWRRILLRAGIEHPRLDAFALTVVGYMGNTILPARGGEALRMFLMAERAGCRRREALGSIVAERLLDAAALVALFAAVTWSGVVGTTGRGAAAAGVGAAVAAAAAAIGYVRLRNRGWGERFADLIRPFARASRLLVGRLGAALLALTLGVWLVEGTIFWLVGRSLGIDLGVIDGVFLVALTSFFLMVPAAPGYVGTFDAALVFGLGALGVTGGSALGFVLLVRFVLFVPITVAGLVVVVLRYGGLRRPRVRAGMPLPP